MSAVATPVDEVPDVLTMSLTDRCIRCDAQAFVRVMLPSGTVIDFCVHHFRESQEALVKDGAIILVDERHRLTAKPSS